MNRDIFPLSRVVRRAGWTTPRRNRSLRRAAAGLVIAAWLTASPAGAQTPTPTQTPTLTPTATATATTTPTVTATATATQTPTPTEVLASATATPIPRPTFNFRAAPVSGGIVTVTSTSDSHGTDNQTVDAGQFEVQNTSDNTEDVTRVEIEVSDPDVLSALTLTGTAAGGLSSSFTATTPSANNVFLLSPGVTLEPGESAIFALTATIAAAKVEATPSSAFTPVGVTPTPLPVPTAAPSQQPFAARDEGPPTIIAASLIVTRPGLGVGLSGVLLLLLAIVAASGRERRGLVVTLGALSVVLLLMWLGLFSGCGTEQTTSQKITAVSGNNDTVPVTFSGVPDSLGTVSRPQPLIFPGSHSGATPTQ